MCKKIIIDCSPGKEEGLALMLALKNANFDIKCITTSYGNASLKETTKSALKPFNLIKNEILVYKGASTSLMKIENDISDSRINSTSKILKYNKCISNIKEEYAWDAIYNIATKSNQKKISIIALGPLTNIAIALYRYEDLANYIEEIIISGGTMRMGDRLPFTENNIYKDPHAFKAVLNSGIKIKMVGLDILETAKMNEDYIMEVFNNISAITELLKEVIDSLGNTKNSLAKTIPLLDIITISVVCNPQICEAEYLPVDVELTRGEMFGRTIVDSRPYSPFIKNAQIVKSISKEGLVNTIKESFIKYNHEY